MMSTLEILAANDQESGKRLEQEYHAWSRTPKWRDHPTDNFHQVKLPDGREEEILRKIIVDARMKESLSFRFWWATKLENGNTALFLSMKDIKATETFYDVCERHCT